MVNTSLRVVVLRNVRQLGRHAGVGIPRVAAESDLDQRIRQITQIGVDAREGVVSIGGLRRVLVVQPQLPQAVQTAQRGRDLPAQAVVVQPQPRQPVQVAQVRNRTCECGVPQVQIVQAGGEIVRGRDGFPSACCCAATGASASTDCSDSV